jgi:hypothetical protein
MKTENEEEGERKRERKEKERKEEGQQIQQTNKLAISIRYSHHQIII